MATDKRGVMVYLPRDVEEALEKYCTENKITRKNKSEAVPSMGTGIVQYLKSQLVGIAPINTMGTILTKEDVLELIREYGTGDALSPDEVQLAIDDAVQMLRFEISRAVRNNLDVASKLNPYR